MGLKSNKFPVSLCGRTDTELANKLNSSKKWFISLILAISLKFLRMMLLRAPTCSAWRRQFLISLISVAGGENMDKVGKTLTQYKRHSLFLSASLQLNRVPWNYCSRTQIEYAKISQWLQTCSFDPAGNKIIWQNCMRGTLACGSSSSGPPSVCLRGR